jgi:hypothetical protein
MLLYVNGDGHASAAEAINQYKTAGEDPNLTYMGKLPHPENVAISWGKMLSLALRAGLLCEAGTDNTIDTIIASTKKYIEEKGTDSLVIIQWPDTTDNEDKLWAFHKELDVQNVKHIFFNSSVPVTKQYDWGTNYIIETYKSKLESANIETVSPNSDYFGKDGHSVWNRFLINYVITHKFI